ncbi:probable ATP-dependent RNA helicase DDX58 [Colossoma macropomum]|uniref:probable ATP-dependent RNA helicase DDX58 n=1 Tax=Colossoma macropomum TaxID=42526 RepID=UPI001863D937|nr:probable ATP-dependent RNA helicase DDX58 [Colossoma macropomum]
MYELEKENLRCFSRYIIQILRPSYIRVFMTTYLDEESVERILSEEKSSVTSAAQMLLERMWQLEEAGWFQAFLDTLHTSEYTGLYAAVSKWDFKELDDMQPFKRLLDRIEPSITKNMKPRELLTHMSDCITQRECEEIRAVEDQSGCVAASERLVDSLRRSDKPWFKVLKMALEACSQKLALQLLEPSTDESEKCVSEDEENMDTMTTVRFEYREEGESDCGLLKSINEINHTDWLNEGAGVMAGVIERAAERKLREYQKELATAAFSGQNTIICAPTGCGKTIVALAICEHHLKKFPGKAKVVFMATKVEVYEQQYKLFIEHFSKDPDVRVTGVCGEMEVCMRTVVESNDVVVLTPQCLVNALQAGELESLQVFSLLLLDECHNTTGKHPYNNIMNRYLDIKLTGSTHTLPQIVGLTASVGIGSFKNQQEAEINICQLCANLDARVIATVTTNIDELRSYVHIPEKDFFEVPPRTSDPFIRIISNIMSNIEELAKKVYNIETLSPIVNRDYGSQKYEQWIVAVQKGCKLLQLDDPEQERRVCRALFNYTEHLRKYNDALIINEDARTKDALDYLQAFIEQVRNAGYDDTERKLTAFFDAQRDQFQRLATEGQENPKLQELKFILEEEYRNNDQTRTVLFVRTRALADALKKWIDESESLKFLKPGVLIGRGRRSSQLVGSGMTLTSQKGVLDSFKSSDQSKILIATSVADEGIDIPQCNLVLMYEYVGNVVKMVQVRGRGRAAGSRCFLISSRKERIEKERQNMQREKIVEKAIASLQTSPEKLQAKVNLFQKTDKIKRDYMSLSPEKPRTVGSYKLLCAKCEKFACFSHDLRVLKECHHVVLDRSVFQRCATEPHQNPKSFGGITKTQKMYCADCKHDWGIIASYLSIRDLPILKIESFVVQNVVTLQKQWYRKWRDVTFAMQEFDLTEITPETWGLRE